MPEQALTVITEDGTVPAKLFGEPGNPGVLMFMDAFGPRPALDEMARRLAEAGYVVLLPDLFYRFGDYGPFDAATAFQDEDKKAELMKMIKGTTQAMTARDTAAFLDALAEHGGIGPIGVVGYCMGGARALTVAAEYPLRVAAAASFHGGGLATEDVFGGYHGFLLFQAQSWEKRSWLLTIMDNFISIFSNGLQ